MSEGIKMRDKYHRKENLKLFFYPQEWLKIIENANESQLESFTMLINTGARYNEARHIKVEDVDYQRNSVVLKMTKVKAKKKETRPNPRHIPISNKFKLFLNKQIKKYNLQPNDYFPMLKNPAANIALKKLAKEIGRTDWEDFSAHNIRKTFECWLIAIGCDGFKVAKHLGHTAQVAMNEYISADIFTYQDKQLIRELLDDLYGYNQRQF